LVGEKKESMTLELEIAVSPDHILDEAYLQQKVVRESRIAPSEISHWKVVKKSIDARAKMPIYRLTIKIWIKEEYDAPAAILSTFKIPSGKNKVLIIGAGPAGYFAALELIERGIRPIIVDRGKDVRARRRDLRAIQQFGEVNPNSNYCFGEGGAGTYSDGKLYTRSHKRGKIQKVLQLLVEHGAHPDILIDTHPHIGSNKLPPLVENIRKTILEFGGTIHFDTRIVDFLLDGQYMKGAVDQNGNSYEAEAVILATGHSARDIYQLCGKKGIKMESKPFALGIRIEHPQKLIDKIQYRQAPRHPNLPASSYKLVSQIKGRGVFSFCMCPGGLVVPAATAPGEIVVNGMSMSRRDSAYANSGIVVAVEPEDLKPFKREEIFAGLAFQSSIEKKMFDFGDGSQKAPAQRMTDFVKGTSSSDLSESSYIPGLISAPLHELLPSSIYFRLKMAMEDFDRKMPGFLTDEAHVIGTESRTSAPIRIPREKDTFMHPEIVGLFPTGEGAGYAGGILSAAMDGQNAARAVVEFLTNS
jgi:uncharacterized FAD-dependent dehydrogenase